MSKQLCIAACLVLFSSCASSQDMSDGGPGFWGGGFQVQESGKGEYTIRAQTDVAPFTNREGARSIWAKHAGKACGTDGYEEKDIKEYSYETMPPTLFGLGKYIVSVKEGVARCKRQ